MTYQSSFKMFVFAIPLMLSACGDANTAETLAVPVDSDFQINVTSDLTTPGAVQAVTFVPNSAASWLGAIVLLTEDGVIHRTDGQSSKPIRISDGPYIDVFGLAREAQPGVFLVLEEDGSVDAFIEIDDAGNFGAIPLTYNGGGIAQFCSNSTPQDTSLWAITTNNSIKKLNVAFQDNAVIELSEDSSVNLPKAAEPLACTMDASDKLSLLTDKGLFSLSDGAWQSEAYPSLVTNLTTLPGTDAMLSSQTSNANILLTESDATQVISLSDGLSIRGTDSVSYVTATGANLGSTFANGAVVAVDGEDQRLVMVALDYVLSELKQSE